MWLTVHFGTFIHGISLLRLFFASTVPGIHDLRFIGIFVAIPCNTMARILVDVICEVLKENHGFTKKSLEGDVKKKMNMSIRCSFAEMYLKVLLKFGRYPDATKQPLVNYFIDGLFGTRNSHRSRTQATEEKIAECGIDGMTQVVLYFWPMLFSDRAALKNKLDEMFPSEMYLVGFLSAFPEMRQYIPANLSHVQAHSFCSGIPKEWNVLVRRFTVTEYFHGARLGNNWISR